MVTETYDSFIYIFFYFKTTSNTRICLFLLQKLIVCTLELVGLIRNKCFGGNRKPETEPKTARNVRRLVKNRIEFVGKNAGN